MKIFKLSSLLLLFMSLLFALSSKSAYATSEYDDTVQVTENLIVKSWDGTYSEDVTHDYLDYFYNQCDKPGAINSYESALSNGVIAVSMVRSSTREYLEVFWSDSSASATFYGSSSGTYNLEADGVSGYFTLDLYSSSSISVVCNYTSSSYTGFQISNDRSVVFGESSPAGWIKVFWSTYNIGYPLGYAGVTVPSSPPGTTLYYGSVDCGNDSLEYMLITQDGGILPVVLSYDSSYRADWSQYLTSSSYTITVGCGNSLATSYASVSPSTSSNDWICDTINDPHYCVLS